MATLYTATWFHKYFSKKPKYKWTTREFRDENNTRFCALGHLQYDPKLNKERKGENSPLCALRDLGNKYGAGIGAINDAASDCINPKNPNSKKLHKIMELEHPKDRILSFLSLAKSGKLKKSYT